MFNIFKPKKPMVAEIPSFDSIELPSYYPENDYYYPLCELEPKLWFVNNVQPDWVIIDAGANIGYYSILFAKLAHQGLVHAFEPTSTYKMLLNNIKHNNINNINTHKIALGAKDGVFKDGIYRIWGQKAERLAYNFTTIDSFVEHNKINRIDAIKIDVDSFDFEVLQGASKTAEIFDPFIIIEINKNTLSKRQQSPNDIFSWFIQRGYKKTQVVGTENFIFKKIYPEEYLNSNYFLPLVWPEKLKATVSDLPSKVKYLFPEIAWEPFSEKYSEPDDNAHDTSYLRYIFKQFSPNRHLEFGTWKSDGSVRAIKLSDSRVWTVSLWDGEKSSDSCPVYKNSIIESQNSLTQPEKNSLYKTGDSKSLTGQHQFQAAFCSRINHSFSDTPLWAEGTFTDNFFDSIFVAGGYDIEAAGSDLFKALHLLKPGGVLGLLGFSPVPEVNAENVDTVGATSLAASEIDLLKSMCDTIFWIEGTSILFGIRKQYISEADSEKESQLLLKAKAKLAVLSHKQRSLYDYSEIVQTKDLTFLSFYFRNLSFVQKIYVLIRSYPKFFDFAFKCRSFFYHLLGKIT
jgi:FkbM family methyltransferase